MISGTKANMAKKQSCILKGKMLKTSGSYAASWEGRLGKYYNEAISTVLFEQYPMTCAP